MAKKSKQKKKQKDSRNKGKGVEKKKRKNSLFWIAGVIAAAVLIMIISGNIPFSSTEGKKGKSFYVQGGETRPVLDPSLFMGMARSAYAAAKKYRDVMDEVYCYCYCDDPPFHHKSLLSCFVDRHGAG